MEQDKFAKQYRLWILVRHKGKLPVDNGPHIPSFAAVESLLDSSTHFFTNCAFTPILPYLAMEYDAIFTTMIVMIIYRMCWNKMNVKMVFFG